MIAKKTLLDLLLPKSILYGVLILSPWLFGSVEPWAKQLLFFFILLAFLLWIIQKKEEPIFFFPGFVTGLVFLFYLLFQILPLPTEIVGLFSAERVEIAKKVASLIPMPPGKEIPSSICLSINPKESYFYLLEFTGIGLFGFLLYQLLTSPKEISSLILAMVINGFILTLFGIIQRATFNGKLYWIRELTQGGDPFGPYVLRTHMGGLLLMIVPLGLGYFLSHFSLSKDNFFSAEINRQRDFVKKYLLLFFLLVLSTGVLLSKSRGAIGSFVISLLLMIALIGSIEKKDKRLSFFLFIFLFSAILFSLWLASDLFLSTTERLIQTPVHEEARAEIWKEALELWKLSPLVGFGLGGFEEAFGLVRTVFPGSYRITHAESDFVELLVDGGILGIIPVFLFIGSMVFYNGLKIKTLDEKNQKLALGALCSFLAGLFQGVANFNMAFMANMLYLLTSAVLLSKLVRLTPKTKNLFKEKDSFLEKNESHSFLGSS
ncbi:O-antigen ligase family protein [Methylacidiphilum caldifontis]|nr:O-antigen ligase family protein [Methylacidiphilum caldifontis]